MGRRDGERVPEESGGQRGLGEKRRIRKPIGRRQRHDAEREMAQRPIACSSKPRSFRYTDMTAIAVPYATRAEGGRVDADDVRVADALLQACQHVRWVLSLAGGLGQSGASAALSDGASAALEGNRRLPHLDRPVTAKRFDGISRILPLPPASRNTTARLPRSAPHKAEREVLNQSPRSGDSEPAASSSSLSAAAAPTRLAKWEPPGGRAGWGTWRN